MLANREGLFHAYPGAVGLGQTRESKLLQVVMQYRLVEELVQGEWLDIAAEGLEITGHHILERRDGTLSENTIESLKAALGWDGRDPFWIQDNAEQLCQQPVQVKLGFEEYNGKQRLKVQFLNPYGAKGGGVPRADDDLRRSVSNRIGAKFRALAGGTPANPPKPAGKPAAAAAPKAAPAAGPKPAASPAPTAAASPAPAKPASPPAPATPPATPPAPSPAAPAAPAAATMEQAWEEFIKHCLPPKWDQESTEKEWFRVLADLFPGKQPDQLTPADWGRMLAEGPGSIIPF
jgi:hypothetical protein